MPVYCPVLARSLLAVLTKQSPCHFPPSRRCEVASCCSCEAISVPLSPLTSLRGCFLLFLLSNLRATFPHLVVARLLLAVLAKQSPCHYPPSRRCEVPSCCSCEAISVSLPPARPCDVSSCFTYEAISVSLSPLSSLRGLFLLFLRSNLRVTTPSRRCEVTSCCSYEAISVSLPPSRPCEVTSCCSHEAISVIKC